MDEEIERLVVQVQADTRGFARDVETMRASLDDGLGAGLERAGATLERSLLGALRRGSLGFEDLRRTALSVLADIAQAVIRSGLGQIGAGGGAGSGSGGPGLADLTRLFAGAFGLPGRATGGNVGPARPYLVGERGPELFVPTSAGQIVPSGGGGARDIRMAITITPPAGTPPDAALQRSSRQLARALRQAIESA